MKRVESQAVPGLTDSKEYGQLHTLLETNSVGGVRPVPIQLRDAVRMRDAAELMMLRHARTMRAEGRTWDEVGYALGMTRQGAQRFLQRHPLTF